MSIRPEQAIERERQELSGDDSVVEVRDLRVGHSHSDHLRPEPVHARRFTARRYDGYDTYLHKSQSRGLR